MDYVAALAVVITVVVGDANVPFTSTIPHGISSTKTCEEWAERGRKRSPPKIDGSTGRLVLNQYYECVLVLNGALTDLGEIGTMSLDEIKSEIKYPTMKRP